MSGNNAKQDQMKGIDPASGRFVRYFHPRGPRWRRHFRGSADFGTVIIQLWNVLASGAQGVMLALSPPGNDSILFRNGSVRNGFRDSP